MQESRVSTYWQGWWCLTTWMGEWPVGGRVVWGLPPLEHSLLKLSQLASDPEPSSLIIALPNTIMEPHRGTSSQAAGPTLGFAPQVQPKQFPKTKTLTRSFPSLGNRVPDISQINITKEGHSLENWPPEGDVRNHPSRTNL